MGQQSFSKDDFLLEVFMFTVRALVMVLLLNIAGCASLNNANQSNESKSTPKLSQAKYKTIWVPDKIEGDRFIEGHRVHIIEESGRWLSE